MPLKFVSDEVHACFDRMPDPVMRDGLDDAVSDALMTLRRESGMDVAFVSRFEDGARTIELVDSGLGADVLPQGMANPLEESWCYRVAMGRLPKLMFDAAAYARAGQAPAVRIKIGTHVSVPILLDGGEIFGTLCTFSESVNTRNGTLALHRLQGAAILLAHRIDAARAKSKAKPHS